LTAAMLRLGVLARVPVPDVPASSSPLGITAGVKPLWEVERDAIEAAIQVSNGNIGEAARALGINASTIYRKRQSWMKAPGPVPAPPMSPLEPPVQ